MKNLIVILTFLFSIGMKYTVAQDLEKLKTNLKENPVKISGGISAQSVLYATQNIEKRQSPFAYILSGNLNLSVLGANVPLTFIYSDARVKYTYPMLQPLNYYGLTPYYKWIKLYLGKNSMDFSRYTLNQMFYGAGIELTPSEKFKFSFMYGKLRDAQKADTINFIIPAYKRMAYALKFEVGNKSDYISLVLFSATDDKKSLPYQSDDSVNVSPSDNFIINLNIKKLIAKHIQINAEYATSALSRNTLLDKSDYNPDIVYKPVALFHQNLMSTQYSDALKSGINYIANKFNVGLNYERIAPDYVSLGLPYFVNDVENITLDGSTAIIDGKVSLSGNFGRQKNNLDNTKLSTAKSTVGSLQCTFVPGPKLNVSANFSNFLSFDRISSDFEKVNQLYPFENVDTLNYSMVSQNSTININYIIGDLTNQNIQKGLNFSLSYQKADSKRGENNYKTDGSNVNSNLSYSINIVPSELMIVASVFSNYSQFETSVFTIGPTISVSKYLLNHSLSINIASAYNESLTNSANSIRIFNNRLNFRYLIKEKHEFLVSAAILNKLSKGKVSNGFSEYTFNFGYTYRFGGK